MHAGLTSNLCKIRKEHEDAKETAKWIKDAGVKHILLPGDLADESVCQ